MKFLSLLVSAHRSFAALNPDVKLPHIHVIESVEEPLNALAARQLVTAHHHLRMQSFLASKLTGPLVHELVLFTGDFTTGCVSCTNN